MNYLRHLLDLYEGTSCTLGEATIDPGTGQVPIEDDSPWNLITRIELRP